MGTIVSYRLPSASSNSELSTTMIDITGYLPSGYADGNLLGVALFDYNYTTHQWQPQTHT